MTSYNSAVQYSGTVVNEVQLTYSTFGQLTNEQQSHSGNVSGSTPAVQYAYDTGASGSNEIRLNALTYPNGRVISYNFTNAVDALFNRITNKKDKRDGSKMPAGSAFTSEPSGWPRAVARPRLPQSRTCAH